MWFEKILKGSLSDCKSIVRIEEDNLYRDSSKVKKREGTRRDVVEELILVVVVWGEIRSWRASDVNLVISNLPRPEMSTYLSLSHSEFRQRNYSRSTGNSPIGNGTYIEKRHVQYY